MKNIINIVMAAKRRHIGVARRDNAYRRMANISSRSRIVIIARRKGINWRRRLAPKWQRQRIARRKALSGARSEMAGGISRSAAKISVKAWQSALDIATISAAYGGMGTGMVTATRRNSSVSSRQNIGRQNGEMAASQTREAYSSRRNKRVSLSF